MVAHTLVLIPRRTAFLSRSSISANLIFFTASASELSGTYRRFVGEDVGSDSLEVASVEEKAEEAPRGGVPGGVVDSASAGSEVNVSN